MIAIVTDSTVGYSTADIASRGVVRVVPVNYQIGECLFEEGALDKNGDFLRRMKGQSVCKTAQPALTEFIRAFRTLTEKGYDVICIVLSSALSGTWSSARVAAAQAGGNIRVIDSGTVGYGMHLLVDEAVNMAKAGLAFEDVVRHLENLKKKIGTVFSVESLDRLIAGGRLNNSKAKTTLNLRPVFEQKVKIVFRENARASRERLEEMCALVPASARRLIVCRCGEDTDVSEFTQMLKARFPAVYIHQRVVGPVLSIHVGEGAFGVAYIAKD